MMKQILGTSFVVLIGFVAIAGCNSGSEPTTQNEPEGGAAVAAHDPHDIPLTDAQIEALKNGLSSYQNALTKVEAYRDTIRDAIAAGDPPKAHRPLDELDVVLEYLPTVAREGQIPRTEWETVNTSAQQIRELFNQVHAQIDAGEEPDYGAVADQIDAAIAKLRGVAPAG